MIIIAWAIAADANDDNDEIAQKWKLSTYIIHLLLTCFITLSNSQGLIASLVSPLSLQYCDSVTSNIGSKSPTALDVGCRVFNLFERKCMWRNWWSVKINWIKLGIISRFPLAAPNRIINMLGMSLEFDGIGLEKRPIIYVILFDLLWVWRCECVSKVMRLYRYTLQLPLL